MTDQNPTSKTDILEYALEGIDALVERLRQNPMEPEATNLFTQGYSKIDQLPSYFQREERVQNVRRELDALYIQDKRFPYRNPLDKIPSQDLIVQIRDRAPMAYAYLFGGAMFDSPELFLYGMEEIAGADESITTPLQVEDLPRLIKAVLQRAITDLCRETEDFLQYKVADGMLQSVINQLEAMRMVMFVAILIEKELAK